MTHHENELRSRVQGWFAGRVPDAWYSGPPEVVIDREEILVVGPLAPADLGADADASARGAAADARAERFRETTREERMQIADEAQHAFRRKVSWGVTVDGERRLFTNIAVPVMTRLRQPERAVLDTLVEAGVARSRSEALAWCVRLVGKNQEEWIGGLREALVNVERKRGEGPSVE
jgi:hypothetical protein